MSFKSNKGYSLIEIGVGLLILTVFLVCSVALFNGSYSTYRMIQQRNIATDLAVTTMETMLQTDADVLTGFFVEEYNSDDGKTEFRPSDELKTFIRDEYRFRKFYEDRYIEINDLPVDEINVTSITDDELESYIYKDKDYVISKYIEHTTKNIPYDEYRSEEVQNGNYGLLVDSVTEEGALDDPITHNSMMVRKTILRLPITDGSVYGDEYGFGNKVLRLKVEVIFTNKVNNQSVTDEDLKSVVLETVKVAK